MRQLALVLVLLAGAGPARASVVTTGDVDPGGYGAAAVPEPAAACLLVAGLLLLCGTRFHRPSSRR
jgi:hypothetical protein